MNLNLRIKNLIRKMKYNYDKKDEEDSMDLIETSNANDKKMNKIFQRLIRRISFSLIIRCLILIPIIIYLFIIITPIKNIQSFIPMEIKNSKKFLIVVAHPDDECLFFSPTIIGLTSRKKQGHLIVLSNGNNYGLGSIRQKELNGSCQQLGIDLSYCLALNITNIQDNPHQWWSKDILFDIIDKYVKEFEIDLLITFDRGGISGHINHRSIAIASEYYIEKKSQTPLIYQLSTVSTLFEFSSIFDSFRTIIKFLPRLFRSLFSTLFPYLFSAPNNKNILFVNSPFGYFQGLKAFHSHRSQMLWFRHLYTTFSRHMFINDLIRISH